MLNACNYRIIIPNKQWDDKGMKHGVWRTYWYDKEEHLMMKSCFRHDKEVGISRSFQENGDRISVFNFHRNYVKVKIYDTTGFVDAKGRAILQYDADSTFEYFWIGKWKFFDSQHRLIRYGYYDNGKEVSIFVPKKKKRWLRLLFKRNSLISK